MGSTPTPSRTTPGCTPPPDARSHLFLLYTHRLLHHSNLGLRVTTKEKTSDLASYLHAAAGCEVWPSLKSVSPRGGPNELVEGAEAEDESWIAVPPPPSLLCIALKPRWRGSTPTPSRTTRICTPPPDARSHP